LKSYYINLKTAFTFVILRAVKPLVRIYLGAQYGYEVKDGKLGKMVRDINVSGNLYETLQNISAIGNDLQFTKRGGCGKGQTNIRSCFGGPQIIVKNLVIGGN